jgi:regulator of cell morphogenesis and NO signaling
MQITARVSVSEAARARHGALGVFDEAGIDYCCRGAASLQDAADDAGLDVYDLIAKLSTLEEQSEAPLNAIVRELIDDHRRCIGNQIPLVRAAIEKAMIVRIERLFSRFAATISGHMSSEERDLLPHIIQLELAENGSAPTPPLRISHRVLGELVEHERLHEQLITMRLLAAEATGTRATIELREKLATFMRDMNRHMHIENNVLYPRAIEIENRLKRLQPA